MLLPDDILTTTKGLAPSRRRPGLGPDKTDESTPKPVLVPISLGSGRDVKALDSTSGHIPLLSHNRIERHAA